MIIRSLTSTSYNHHHGGVGKVGEEGCGSISEAQLGSVEMQSAGTTQPSRLRCGLGSSRDSFNLASIGEMTDIITIKAIVCQRLTCALFLGELL